MYSITVPNLKCGGGWYRDCRGGRVGEEEGMGRRKGWARGGVRRSRSRKGGGDEVGKEWERMRG